MKEYIRKVLCILSALVLSLNYAFATPALEVLGKDYEFPNKIEGFPAKFLISKGWRSIPSTRATE